MFYPCKPARITVQGRLFVKKEYDFNWIAELSIPGIRCLAHHHHNRVDLWSRGSMRITAPLVETRRQIKNMIPDETILDGVLFHQEGEGRVNNHYFVFDIPQFKNRETGQLWERFALLQSLDKGQPLIKITEHHQPRHKRTFYYQSVGTQGVSGIVLKDLSSIYPIGTKSIKITDSWLEVRPNHSILEDILKSNKIY